MNRFAEKGADAMRRFLKTRLNITARVDFTVSRKGVVSGRTNVDQILNEALDIALATMDEAEKRDIEEGRPEKVIFTKNWKCYHPGNLYRDGQLQAACNCAGSSSGSLARNAIVVDCCSDNPWEEANCGCRKLTWGERHKKVPA